MIVVRVELWSAVTHKVTELARCSIANTGEGTDTLGNYIAWSYRGRSKEDLDKAMLNETVTHRGVVNNHRRKAEHVWNLVAKALKAMGYGE